MPTLGVGVCTEEKGCVTGTAAGIPIHTGEGETWGVCGAEVTSRGGVRGTGLLSWKLDAIKVEARG